VECAASHVAVAEEAQRGGVAGADRFDIAHCLLVTALCPPVQVIKLILIELQ